MRGAKLDALVLSALRDLFLLWLCYNTTYSDAMKGWLVSIWLRQQPRLRNGWQQWKPKSPNWSRNAWTRKGKFLDGRKFGVHSKMIPITRKPYVLDGSTVSRSRPRMKRMPLTETDAWCKNWLRWPRSGFVNFTTSRRGQKLASLRSGRDRFPAPKQAPLPGSHPRL